MCPISQKTANLVTFTEEILNRKLFTIEIFIFAIFLQQIDLEQSQFQKMGVALTEFFLIQIVFNTGIKESGCKAPKVKLDKYFYH